MPGKRSKTQKTSSVKRKTSRESRRLRLEKMQRENKRLQHSRRKMELKMQNQNKLLHRRNSRLLPPPISQKAELLSDKF